MSEFKPKSLITYILTETKDLFEYKPCFDSLPLPDILIGDKVRLKYILARLLKHSIDRNRNKKLELIQIRATVSDDDADVFSKSSGQFLLVTITD